MRDLLRTIINLATTPFKEWPADALYEEFKYICPQYSDRDIFSFSRRYIISKIKDHYGLSYKNDMPTLQGETHNAAITI